MKLRKNSRTLIILTLSLILFPNIYLATPYVQGADIMAENNPIKVVTSVELLKDFVEQIGANYTEVTAVMVDGTEDPHTYEPTQSEINALIQADVLFLMGRPDLEPWWEGYNDSDGHSEGGYKQIVLQDNPDLVVIAVMNESMAQNDPLLGIANPHGWMSPIIAKEMVRNVYLGLNPLIEPESQSILNQSYTDYIEELDNLIGELNAKKSQFEGLKVVVHHPSFMYLFDLLGIERIAIIEEQHDVEPSPQHIQEIKDLMQENNCTTIVSQANLDEGVVLQLARDMNASIVWGIPLLGMSSKNGTRISTYTDMIRYNLWALNHPETPESEKKIIPGYSLVQWSLGMGILVVLVHELLKLRRIKK